MPSRSLRTIRSGPLLDEVSARLPLFENLPPDTIQQLSTAGYGRGFLTASLRARLRKAGYRDLGQLAQTSPEAIARVRKFGPIRVESVRTFILTEIARRLPGARDGHTAGASAERRLGLLRAMPVERVCFDAGILAGLGLEGRSCADLASRSRSELLDTGLVTSGEVDRLVTTLARLLGEGQTPSPSAVQAPEETPSTETETLAARRAALLATQDREWEEAAPARD